MVLVFGMLLVVYFDQLNFGESYYSKFQWQEIIEIFNLILYLIGFIVYCYFSIHYLKTSEYNLFKLCKFDVTFIQNGFKKIRRNESRYLIINFVILTVFGFIISIILLTIKDYDDGYSLDIGKNWKLSPIQSLEISSTYKEYKLGTFKGLSEQTYGEKKSKPLYKFNGYSTSGTYQSGTTYIDASGHLTNLAANPYTTFTGSITLYAQWAPIYTIQLWTAYNNGSDTAFGKLYKRIKSRWKN